MTAFLPADPDAVLAELDRWETAGDRARLATAYRRDPLRWIDDNVWIASKFDVEGNPGPIRLVKMRLWPQQRETIAEWIDLERLARTGEVAFSVGLLIEKSRQIGETWGFAATVAWLQHFTATRGLFMHTSASEVCDAAEPTIESFFGRVRLIDQNLDGPARPHEPPLAFRGFSGAARASIRNPATGAYVRGECQRDDPGRGSSYDWALVDEASRVTHGELVHQSIDEAAPRGKVYLSTPDGDENFHARLCDERPEGWGYLRLHWSEHPVYGAGAHVAAARDERSRKVRVPALPGCAACDAVLEGVPWTARSPLPHRYPGRLASPWYDRQVVGKTDEQVASELDIDRAGALTAKVYPEFQNARHVVDAGIPYDPELPLELAWDFGQDATPIVVIQESADEVRLIGLHERGDLFGTTAEPSSVAASLREYLEALGVDVEALGGTLAIRGVGDPSGQNRQTIAGAPAATYRALGWSIDRPPSYLTSGPKAIETQVAVVKGLLLGRPKQLLVCGRNGREMARHLRSNTWPVDAQGLRRLGSTLPRDDVHNHACRALAYWAVDRFPPEQPPRRSASLGRGDGGVSSRRPAGPTAPATRRRGGGIR